MTAGAPIKFEHNDYGLFAQNKKETEDIRNAHAYIAAILLGLVTERVTGDWVTGLLTVFAVIALQRWVAAVLYAAIFRLLREMLYLRVEPSDKQ